MARAFILLLDSFGIGALPDAKKFGDDGANTFLHIKEYCLQEQANITHLHQGTLKIPNLERLGLSAAASLESNSMHNRSDCMVVLMK